MHLIIHSSTAVCCPQLEDVEPVAVVVLDGEELPISILSDPTQTCPPAWSLTSTPRRSCTRPPNAGNLTCYSAMFSTRGVQYTQVCGRVIRYQFEHPGAFFDSEGKGIDSPYVDGVSLTYGSPRQHVWTFANAIDEYPLNYEHKCPCTNVTEQPPIPIPSFVDNDYFCETGVLPGECWDPI